MTTLAHLRKAALALPGTAERATRTAPASFTVRGKPFAALGGDGGLRLHLPAPDAEAMLAAIPAAAPLARGAVHVGVTVPLAGIDGQQLNHWVRRAWSARAPEHLAAREAAAGAAVPGTVGDLPKAIGAPATRALAAAGVTTLDRVAARGRAELSALHGVGPKALRVLAEALAASGRTFAD
ncbi:MmcQ/YjbR family DNA-binding protein [Streptomyces sp. NPDC049906]|uniref:MmcQ/YjbR family DNA-binding protein n=1 Tax=Streptomyces sp. NPDC049906 TaxID=3155656 RepID=UPI0034283AFC